MRVTSTQNCCWWPTHSVCQSGVERASVARAAGGSRYRRRAGMVEGWAGGMLVWIGGGKGLDVEAWTLWTGAQR